MGNGIRPRRPRRLTCWSAFCCATLTLAGCSQDADQPAAAPQLQQRPRLLQLGSSDLTSGISGQGPLTVTEIKHWLGNPLNHEPISLQLPIGLEHAANDIELPADNPLTPARIELGRQLFFERRVGLMTCGDCHQPAQAFTSFQVSAETHLNPQVTFNRLFSKRQFWTGKAKSLEAQPEFPVRHRFEMNSSPDEWVETLSGIEGYRLQFERIFGGVTFAAASQALTTFQRTLVTGPSAYDLYVAREEKQNQPVDAVQKLRLAEIDRLSAIRPMSASAIRGMSLFFENRTSCSVCHSGPNFTDEDFHNVGIGMDTPDRHEHLGRYEVTGRVQERGEFKTPTLRNVSKSPPYMHDGRFERLEEVIEHFNVGGFSNPELSPLMKPLKLSDHEKRDLLSFLNSLDSPLPAVEEGRLPE